MHHFIVLIHWQESETWIEFLSVFQDQVSSEGAQAAMTELQEKLQMALNEGKISKIHVMDVFLLKSLKAIKDSNDESGQKLSDSELGNHKMVLSRQLAEISSKPLGITEDDFHPLLLAEARQVVN